MIANKSQLTGRDLIWLFNATTDAFNEVKEKHKKTKELIDGEVFTNLRRAARENPAVSEAVRRLFYGKKKNFTYRLDGVTTQKDKELLVVMYDSIRKRIMSSEPDPLTGLEQALFAMQASARKAEEAAAESVKLREGLEDIRALLEDKSPLLSEEENNVE